jgi:hypothetical protein
MRTSASVTKLPPLCPHETWCAHWVHKLRAARNTMIRKLLEIPADRERKAHDERILKARRVLLQWI